MTIPSTTGNGRTPAGQPLPWLSVPAVLWALREAPNCPPDLVSVLVIVASYTGIDGRGAWPSVDEIARQSRKSERQVQYGLRRLVKAKLITRGDQSLVRHIRADRRPVVYDVAMPRGATHCTPSHISVPHCAVHR
jgi:hypothetical protein